jgi:hypothetical protein
MGFEAEPLWTIMKQTESQLTLPYDGLQLAKKSGKKSHPYRNGNINKLDLKDKPIHDWYRFVLSYPPHFVRKYIADFGITSQNTILDPFCGTGTTLVESKLHGLPGVGVEANPFAHFASSVKTDWSVDPDELLQCAEIISKDAISKLAMQGIDDNAIFKSVSAENLPLKKVMFAKSITGSSRNPSMRSSPRRPIRTKKTTRARHGSSR